MKKKVELPLLKPKFSTYHGQGALGGMLAKNPTIWNWLLNEAVILRCERDFLFGYSSPKVTVEKTDTAECPHIDKRLFQMEFTKGYINPIIRTLLDKGFYAYFAGIDDYYMEGKSWYGERHFGHDGLICGYDMEEKTYTVFAYDKNWIFRKIKIPMRCFEEGRKSMFKRGNYGVVFGFLPRQTKVDFSPECVYKKLVEYLDSSLEKYPPTEKGAVLGIAVQEYIVKYLDMHIDGSIPYEKLDRRVFRLIWEHKKVMWERIHVTEEILNLDHSTSDAYETILAEADTMRMLYASHHMKRRDSLLLVIKRKLLSINEAEKQLLSEFIEKMEEKFNDETLGNN